MKVEWLDFKNFLDIKLVSPQYIELSDRFIIHAFDGPFELECELIKNVSDTSDLDDWNTNYKSNGNRTIDDPRDSDGSRITRTKTTQTGWHYEPRALDFFTAKLKSLYNRKDDGNDIDDGTDYGDAITKYYNNSGAQLIQGEAETDAAFQIRLDGFCVKTVVDWQSTYNFDIIGGKLHIKNTPLSRAYIWCTIAPDIPAYLGGSVPYFAGGFNLSFFYDGQTHDFNGRGTKSFAYDPVYNSNKIRFIVKHAVGEQIGIQIILDQFKQ